MRARHLTVVFLGVILVGAGLAYYISSTATGTLVIQVRDAVVGWSSVTVTFTQVSVHPANAANSSDWITLNLTQSRIDFLSLGNLTNLLALDRLPSGMYTQIRIVVGSAAGVPSSGGPVTMSVPDGILKTTTPFTLRGGGTTTVTLDFDLARSIHEANGVWIFTPVLGQVDVA